MVIATSAPSIASRKEFGGDDALLGGGFDERCVEIESSRLDPGARQRRRHRTAHVAQTDESRAHHGYDKVGMTKLAPVLTPPGQRDATVFVFV